MCITRTAGIRIPHWHKKTNISLNNWLQMGCEMSWSSNAFNKNHNYLKNSYLHFKENLILPLQIIHLLHALETHLHVTFSFASSSGLKLLPCLQYDRTYQNMKNNAKLGYCYIPVKQVLNQWQHLRFACGLGIRHQFPLTATSNVTFWVGVFSM